jgi:hypothetical protein
MHVLGVGNGDRCRGRDPAWRPRQRHWGVAHLEGVGLRPLSCPRPSRPRCGTWQPSGRCSRRTLSARRSSARACVLACGRIRVLAFGCWRAHEALLWLQLRGELTGTWDGGGRGWKKEGCRVVPGVGEAARLATRERLRGDAGDSLCLPGIACTQAGRQAGSAHHELLQRDTQVDRLTARLVRRGWPACGLHAAQQAPERGRVPGGRAPPTHLDLGDLSARTLGLAHGPASSPCAPHRPPTTCRHHTTRTFRPRSSRRAARYGPRSLPWPGSTSR